MGLCVKENVLCIPADTEDGSNLIFAARRQPRRVLTDRSAVSGAPVLAYWAQSRLEGRSERYFHIGFPLPCTHRQLSAGPVSDMYLVSSSRWDEIEWCYCSRGWRFCQYADRKKHQKYFGAARLRLHLTGSCQRSPSPLTLTRSELFCRPVFFQRPFRPNVQYLFTTKFSGMVMARFKNGASHCGTRTASTQSSSSSQFSTNVPP